MAVRRARKKPRNLQPNGDGFVVYRDPSKTVYFAEKEKAQAYALACDAADYMGSALPPVPPKFDRCKRRKGVSARGSGFQVTRGRGSVFFSLEKDAVRYRRKIERAIQSGKPLPPIPPKSERCRHRPDEKPLQNWIQAENSPAQARKGGLVG